MQPENADNPRERWHVYLVRCSAGTLYTGIATDVERRFVEHGEGRGAKYLRGRGPLELVLSHEVGERGHALKVERRIKSLSRGDKDALVLDRNLLDRIVGEASA